MYGAIHFFSDNPCIHVLARDEKYGCAALCKRIIHAAQERVTSH